MTEPQIWTMIGAFTAVMLGGVAAMSTLFLRVLRAEFAGVSARFNAVEAEFRTEFGAVRTEIGSLRSEMNVRFDQVDTRFAAVHTRIDGLDRDVQALVTHTFGLDRGT